MFMSAAIFGYFGFSTIWLHTGSDGQTLPFVIILEWSLKGGAVGFALSGMLSLIASRPGEFVYAIVGIISSIGLVIAGVLDIRDTAHTAMSPILLFIFAAWNGFSSVDAIRRLRLKA